MQHPDPFPGLAIGFVYIVAANGSLALYDPVHDEERHTAKGVYSFCALYLVAASSMLLIGFGKSFVFLGVF